MIYIVFISVLPSSASNMESLLLGVWGYFVISLSMLCNMKKLNGNF